MGRRLGCILAQLSSGPVEELWVELAGRASALDPRPVTAEVLTGLLSDRLDVPVNRVNATMLAKRQGRRFVAVGRDRTIELHEQVFERATDLQSGRPDTGLVRAEVDHDRRHRRLGSDLDTSGVHTPHPDHP